MHRAPMGSKLVESPSLGAFSRAFQSTKAFCNTSLQKKSRISGSVRWAVYDREKFNSLVQDLRDLVSDLNKFTDDMGIASSQRLVIEYEMELIDDEPSLELIAAASACDDDDDLLSYAARSRLNRVKEQSVANQSVGFDDSVSMISSWRYTSSMSTLVDDYENEVAQESESPE